MQHDLGHRPSAITGALAALGAFSGLVLACGAADEAGGPEVPAFREGAGAPAAGPGGGASSDAGMNPSSPAGGVNPTPSPSYETPSPGAELPLAAGGAAPATAAGEPKPADAAEPQNPEEAQNAGQPESAPTPAGGAPNLFRELLGRTTAEVDAKVRTAVDRFFGVGTNDPASPTLNGGARCYYTLPQDRSLGFIWAADSADIRSEGMSYGMFIAVQMGLQEQFDSLWRFAQRFVQYAPDANPPAWRRYFRWTGRVDARSANEWVVSYADEPPASDGEEYFAAALYLADRRWGSAGAIDYGRAADELADAMLNNAAANPRFPLFHEQAKMVVFVPFGSSNEFSDPSYHLPAFYDLFAEDGPAGDAARWREIAEVSRDYLVRSAHPSTGLHPDYATFEGAPTQGFQASDHDTFSFDAWRVPLNLAVDHVWSGPDARMRAQLDKYHAFFAQQRANGGVQNSRFDVDGSGGRGGASPALVATLAAGALATEGATRTTFVNELWNVAQPTGQFRYYQGSVYLLGLLATAGYFDFAWQ